MSLISCCSLAILLSVSNATAMESAEAGKGDKKESSLGAFLKETVITNIKKSGEYSRKAATFYGAYILCRLATDYVVLPIYKKITSLSENGKNQNCPCGKKEEVSKEQPPVKGNRVWAYLPFPRRK